MWPICWLISVLAVSFTARYFYGDYGFIIACGGLLLASVAYGIIWLLFFAREPVREKATHPRDDFS